MAVIGERQVTGGNGGGPSGQEGWISSDYGNALRDSHNRLLGKFLIRAGNKPLYHHYRAMIARLISQITSGRRGTGMREIWGKLAFRPKLCYFATCEKNWLREEDRLGDFARAKRHQNLAGTEIAMDAA
ncbi:MAG: hypothetical protein L6277_03930 [Desulfobacterales bacterium]|nr:hypothetical protein [Pseudomonadota bacterium]MBU4354920.1 hypothetical protein [Pseudomonadota bacterium]MCG2771224.1 hypothetical protein [Desulfobacterales bacterium]